MKRALHALLAKFGIHTTWQIGQWEQELLALYGAEPILTIATFDEAPLLRNM